MNGTNDAEKISSFLSSTARGPAALLIEGEVGIGKTAAWLAAAEEARLSGFRVLSARASRDEREFAFGIASELITDVEADVLSSLPKTQRIAAERNLLQVADHQSTDDQRAVVAAFTAIVNKLANASPVLVAIDDVQWIDAASRDLLAFAARRLRGRVRLLLTERTTPDGAASWLKLDSPDALSRMRIRPMEPSGLQRMITDRVGRSFSRPTMMRIAEVSGGNPFYALELARSLNNPTPAATAALPPALAEIMRVRVGLFDDEVQRVLLAAACVSDPTVDVMATMTSTTVDHLVHLLEEPETHGVVTIEGNRVQFTHPVLAYGVYSQALPAQRRRMHRVLADLESAPEQRARHTALAVVSADAETLTALDVAATVVSVDGDPAAAAELVELAIGRGGDTTARRLEAARHHLRAGDLERTRGLAESAAAGLAADEQRAVARMLVASTLMCHGDFGAAAEMFAQATIDAPRQPALLVRAHLCLAMAQLSLGNADGAHRHSVQAMTHAERLKDPHLISQSLAMHVTLLCRRGLALDQKTLERATNLEDLDADAPAPFSAHVVNALVLAWTGRLAEAKPKLAAVVARRASRGADCDLPWLQFHAAIVDVGLGRYDDAARTAEDMLLRAEQIGGNHFRILAAVPAALAAAYAGREQDARKAVESALADTSAPDGQWTTPWPTMALGFLEVSLGNHAEALNVLQPLLSRWRRAVDVDIATFYFIPDAVEAMIAMNTLDPAEELTTSLEHIGSRLNHPWMSADGALCRGLLLAARGDLVGAERAALRAMAEHGKIPAPFERARTQLVLGGLQRRLRRRQAARTTLQAAVATFQSLGAPIWAARAEAELERINLLRGHESELTPAEQRVAELAATGMTNKDIAAALFISPKTVESNLGRVYRKLGIRTRFELGRRLNADTRESTTEEES
ncbi:MAG: transcriptional regulator, luxR family [Mycobacterium sp.]|nr:transcriptional regulator, luxR family [Mycobacterium sp.]